jgi:hypothetical protein
MRVEDKPKRDSRLFRLQGSAKFAKNHKTRPPGGAAGDQGFVISPEIPAALVSIVMFRTLCGSASEQSVKFGQESLISRTRCEQVKFFDSPKTCRLETPFRQVSHDPIGTHLASTGPRSGPS